MIYMWIILLMIIGSLVYIGYYFTNITLYPKTFNYDESYELEVANGCFDDKYYKELDKEEIYIDTNFNYKLHGIWIPHKNSKKTIIFAHGFNYTLYGSIKYMDMFYKKGFNVLVYDHRFHGHSGGENCTMGYYEKYDLQSCVDWVINKVGSDSIIGTHGESMGAATVLMHAALDNRINFAVADCPFESVKEQYTYRLKIEYKLPSFPIINLTNLVTKMRINAFYGDVSPISTIGSVKTPILFIHGDSDKYIPYSNTINLFNAKKGTKKLYLAKGADHAKSFIVDKLHYEEVVNEFLSEVGLLHLASPCK